MRKYDVKIPYCANCMRKTKKDGFEFGEYYCDVAVDILPNGIVTPDTDGTHCVELGVYMPVQSNQ
ncbi:MAG: hypothetical protein IKN84_04960 [Bacteroidales bacterium]|nr:hypothetical protein [Bacteroidales bacterium]